MVGAYASLESTNEGRMNNEGHVSQVRQLGGKRARVSRSPRQTGMYVHIVYRPNTRAEYSCRAQGW